MGKGKDCRTRNLDARSQDWRRSIEHNPGGWCPGWQRRTQYPSRTWQAISRVTGFIEEITGFIEVASLDCSCLCEESGPALFNIAKTGPTPRGACGSEWDSCLADSWVSSAKDAEALVPTQYACSWVLAETPAAKGQASFSGMVRLAAGLCNQQTWI